MSVDLGRVKLKCCFEVLAHVLHERALHAEHGGLVDPVRAQKRAVLGEDLVADRVGALGETAGWQGANRALATSTPSWGGSRRACGPRPG